jgi:hypothetical protein
MSRRHALPLAQRIIDGLMVAPESARDSPQAEPGSMHLRHTGMARVDLCQCAALHVATASKSDGWRCVSASARLRTACS